MKNDIFNYLICKQKASLKSFAMQFTNNTDDANHLVEETQLKAMRYSKLYQEGTNLRSWLYIIMKNTFVNDYVKDNKHKSVLETSQDLSSFQLLITTSNDCSNHTLMNEDIFKALALLPSDNYVPFIKYFEGFKYQEIADELAISVETVKTRIYTARQLLKKNLKMYNRQLERSRLEN